MIGVIDKIATSHLMFNIMEVQLYSKYVREWSFFNNDMDVHLLQSSFQKNRWNSESARYVWLTDEIITDGVYRYQTLVNYLIEKKEIEIKSKMVNMPLKRWHSWKLGPT